MKLTGIEVPVETLSKIEPNTALVVISDDQGKVKVVKIDPQSVPEGESFLKVTANACDQEEPEGGCWVIVGGHWRWVNPCPY